MLHIFILWIIWQATFRYHGTKVPFSKTYCEQYVHNRFGTVAELNVGNNHEKLDFALTIFDLFSLYLNPHSLHKHKSVVVVVVVFLYFNLVHYMKTTVNSGSK